MDEKDIYSIACKDVDNFRKCVNEFGGWTVCLTDACFNILYPHCKNVITYNGLLACAPYYAMCHRSEIRIPPRILFVDYKLDTGLSANHLATQFLDTVCAIIKSLGDNRPVKEIEDSILYNIYFGFLLDHPCTKLIRTRYNAGANMFMSQTSYVRTCVDSCYESYGEECQLIKTKPNLGCFSCCVDSETVDIISKEANNLGFNYEVGNRDKSYISVVCSGDDVKAVPVLQIINTRGQMYIEPNVILANIDTTKFFEFCNKIFSEKAFSSINRFIAPSVVNNLLCAVLCYNIMCMFQLQKFLDKEKVKANFGYAFNLLIDELFAIQKPFLSLEDMTKFTTGTLGKISKDVFSSTKDIDYSIKLQNVIDDIHREKERRFCRVATGNALIDYAQSYHKQSYHDVINIEVNPTSELGFAETFHELLRLRNLGIINLCFYNEENQKDNFGIVVDESAWTIMFCRHYYTKYGAFFSLLASELATCPNIDWIMRTFKKVFDDEFNKHDIKTKNELNEIISYMEFMYSIKKGKHHNFWYQYEIIFPNGLCYALGTYDKRTDDELDLDSIEYVNAREKVKQKIKKIKEENGNSIF